MFQLVTDFMNLTGFWYLGVDAQNTAANTCLSSFRLLQLLF